MFRTLIFCCLFSLCGTENSTAANYFIVFTQETGSIKLCHQDTTSWSSWGSTPVKVLATLHINPDGHFFNQNERAQTLCRRPVKSISHQKEVIYLVGNVALPFPHLFKWKKPHQTNYGTDGKIIKVIWARSDEFLVRICQKPQKAGTKRVYEVTLFPPGFDRTQVQQ